MSRFQSLLGFSIFLTSGLIAFSSHADETNVDMVYIGGFQSTREQAQAWKAAVKSKYPGLKIHAYGLKGGASEKQTIISANEKTIEYYTKLLNDPKFKGPLTLVAHSDGSWVMNEIVRQVTETNRKKIKLVNLDGYASNGPEFKNVDVECWTTFTSEVPTTLSCEDIPKGATRSSLGAAMSRCKPGSCKALGVSDCKGDKWCLHFSIINRKSGKNGLNSQNWNSKSYEGMEPFIPYIKPQGVTAPPEQKPTRPQSTST